MFLAHISCFLETFCKPELASQIHLFPTLHLEEAAPSLVCNKHRDYRNHYLSHYRHQCGGVHTLQERQVYLTEPIV